ncbi:hypothetical protein [Roseospira marina]|uniref:hypothetical protein n=1 Tax=Roseospira marina TaxID=140057 RepID=UPI0014786098|nr:hypothetical protein [Roseospira marina]MBB4315392.1 hypothetical protein [Roseospira marina]MBB5088463.1 hypothetical protein [Roseospira marina]
MKRVDPIHFFDDKGVSALVRENLEAENAALREKNARLERTVRSQALRIRTLMGPDTLT